ncbi:MAG TPA: cysteine hydrolase [Devosia sp.]|jgi:nicotinamidase-related amidase|nr:cysteine hydrolase [Devosia sp.]
MAENLTLDRQSTAVLAMDFQNSIVDNTPDREALLEREGRLLAAARAAGVRVIYIVVGFRPGFPEVSPRNQIFGAISQSGRFGPDDTSTQIHAAVAPAAGEVVVTKHRVGGFLGTDLDMILRAHGIDTLVLTGIATSGVVLSTLRYAADADYRLVVARDCCADRDPEVHRVLLDKVFPRQAIVTGADEVIAALR